MARYEAGAKLKAKYQMLEAKEELINSVFDKARKGLEDLPEKSEYKEVLKRLFVDAGITLNEEKLELVLPKGHL